MITNFNYDNCADSGVIFRSVLEQIEMLHDNDPAMAGEFAIAAIQIILTGENNSDNFMIQLALKQMEAVAANNRTKREHRVEQARNYKIKEKKLDQIAELTLQGLTQKEIAEQINESQQTVSYRLRTIKSDYPELLEDDSFYKKYKKYKDNVNDNVNVNVNVNESDFVEPSAAAEVSLHTKEIEEIQEPEYVYLGEMGQIKGYQPFTADIYEDKALRFIIGQYPDKNAQAIAWLDMKGY